METLFAMDAVLPSLGPVFVEYKNDPEGAIRRLLKEKTGDARAVWERADLGQIDLIYGNSKGGLAHIEIKHPEIISLIPSLLKNGKLLRKTGSQKVYLVSNRSPADVVVIALDWHGTAKTWIVTSYVDVQGLFTGELKTMNTESLDSALVEILRAGQGTIKSLGDDLIGVKPTLDDAGPVPDVAATMARMKLTGELGSLRKQIAALGTGAGDMLARIWLVSRSNQIRKELGVGSKPAENPHVATLRAVAAGQHDTRGLPELLGLIQEAVNGLDEAGLLTGDADGVANEAITHWAELEERLSANG